MNTSDRTTLYKQICIGLWVAVLVLGWYVLRTPDSSTPPNTKVPEKILGYTGAMDITNDPLKVPLTPTVVPVIETPPVVTPPLITDSWVTIEPPTTNTGELMATGSTNTGALVGSGGIVYFNESLGYGYTLPKNSWYQAYGARDGASHSIGIYTSSGGTTFEDASVRVWYYPKTLLPELGTSENGFFQDPSTNMTYLKLGVGTIRIEGNMESAVVNSIIQTVNRR